MFLQVVIHNWQFVASVPYAVAHYYVRQMLCLVSHTSCYCSWCVQILWVYCVLDIFAGDVSHTSYSCRFRLTYRLILREKELHFNIGVYNPSKELTFSFNLLLHTYFKVPDVRRCQITGLHGCTFIDKVTHWILHCGCYCSFFMLRMPHLSKQYVKIRFLPCSKLCFNCKHYPFNAV
jgi:hypothetical protein